jgi:predicted N-acetyltransferase YhbS
MPSTISIRAARAADLDALHAVIERAYRGDSARGGWTHEADLLDGPRTSLGALTAILADPAQRLLGAWDGPVAIGCVAIADRGDGLAYLGQLCVEPSLQAGGIGRLLIDAAERTAATTFGARRIEMTVIDSRDTLVGYYVRRGYAVTGERRDFPIALDPPMFMTVLEKPLAALAPA